MTIELLSCEGCWRVLDQFSFIGGCPSCSHKFVRAVSPTRWNLFLWFIGDWKHVVKLFILDFKEKKHE